MNSQILRGPDIGNRNEKLVLYSIYTSNGISQSEVAKLTGLKPPTVLRIFSNLSEKGLIEISDQQRDFPDKKGRKPIFYRTNPDAYYSIGIDFWARSAVLVIVNFQGVPVYKDSLALEPGMDAEAVTERLQELIETSIDRFGISLEKVLGIGIGSPGRVDVQTGAVLYYSGFRNMVNFNISERMEKRFGFPAIIHNTTAVIALSEYRYGKGQNKQSIMAVTVRSGVGASLVSGGQVFINQNRTILELGHMSIDLNGVPCVCGGRGCLEAYISESNIVRDLKPYVDLDFFEGIDIVLDEGNPKAIENLREKARMLAFGIRNLFQLFGPELFIIVTRSMKLSEFFAAEIREAIDFTTLIPGGAVEVEVMADRYDPEAAGHGAADLVLDHYFSK